MQRLLIRRDSARDANVAFNLHYGSNSPVGLFSYERRNHASSIFRAKEVIFCKTSSDALRRCKCLTLRGLCGPDRFWPGDLRWERPFRSANHSRGLDRPAMRQPARVMYWWDQPFHADRHLLELLPIGAAQLQTAQCPSGFRLAATRQPMNPCASELDARGELQDTPRVALPRERTEGRAGHGHVRSRELRVVG